MHSILFTVLLCQTSKMTQKNLNIYKKRLQSHVIVLSMIMLNQIQINIAIFSIIMNLANIKWGSRH